MSDSYTFPFWKERAILALFTLARPFYLKQASAYLVDSLFHWPDLPADATWVCGSGAVTASCVRHAVDKAIEGKSGKFILFGGGNEINRMPFARHYIPVYAAHYAREARKYVIYAAQNGLLQSREYHDKFGQINNLNDKVYTMPSVGQPEAAFGIQFFKDLYFMRTGRQPNDDGFVLAYEDKSRNAQQNYLYALDMRTEDGKKVSLNDFEFVRVNTVPFGPRREIGTGLRYQENRMGPPPIRPDMILMADMAWPTEDGCTYQTHQDFFVPNGKVVSCVPGVVMHEDILMRGWCRQGGKYARFFKDFSPEAEIDRMIDAYAERPYEKRSVKPKSTIIPKVS